MRSDEIKQAISRRYPLKKNVLFLTEVKTGSTWFAEKGELLKIDALVISRSWSKPNIIGYEVKVSHSDFMNDTKWPGYLPYCHSFYFACPEGVIQPAEIDSRVGLIWVKDNLSAVTKKKALFRDIEMPFSMFYHLVISHMESDRHPFFSSNREKIDAWVKDKGNRKDLSYIFKSSLHKELQDARDTIKQFNKAEGFPQELKEILGRYGIHTWQSGWMNELEEKLKTEQGIRNINYRVEDLEGAIVRWKDSKGKAL